MADRAAGLPADATTAAEPPVSTAEMHLVAEVAVRLGIEPGRGAGDILLGLWKAGYHAGAADERKRSAAAGPVIAADAARQERQRIRELALSHNAMCHHMDGAAGMFADLLGGDAP